MDRYIKNKIIKTLDEISVEINGISYYNPTEEMVLSDGWSKESPHKLNPSEPLLEDVIYDKIIEIETYDKSKEVNEFTIQGQSCWISRDLRVSLTNDCRIAKSKGLPNVTFWNGDTPITLPVDVAMSNLEQLEIYAWETYNVTQQHKTNVRALTTKEEVEAYDYKTGYPEKLVFE